MYVKQIRKIELNKATEIFLSVVGCCIVSNAEIQRLQRIILFVTYLILPSNSLVNVQLYEFIAIRSMNPYLVSI